MTNTSVINTPMTNTPVTNTAVTNTLVINSTLFRTAALALFALFLLLGCTSSQRIPDASEESPQNGVEGGGQETSVPTELPPDGAVAVREIEAVQVELAAVKYLLDSAQEALLNNQLDRAEAVANRALKIDRRAARAYLVKAEAQYRLENYQQSLVTAEQGLIYAPSDSNIGIGLRLLIENATSAMARLP